MEFGHTKSEEKAIQQARVRRIMKSLQSVWTSIRRRGREEYLLLSGDERRQLLLSLFEHYQNNIVYKGLPHLLFLLLLMNSVLLLVNTPVGFACLVGIVALAGSALSSWYSVESAGRILISLL